MFRLYKLAIIRPHVNIQEKHWALRLVVGSIYTVRCVNILLKLRITVKNYPLEKHY
jgi:hypothetical protein